MNQPKIMEMGGAARQRSSFWRLARFLYRLPIYWREDQSQLMCSDRHLGSGVLFVDGDRFIRCPNHIVASDVFKRMTFERAGQRELSQFVALSRGCRRFVDVGASGGYFSSVFAQACEAPANLLSIECDPPSIEVLEDTRKRNARDGVSWSIDKRGISDGAVTEIEIVSSGYGGEVTSESARATARRYAGWNATEALTYIAEFSDLETICAEHGIVPDLLKIDIEGYEFELFQSSREFLERTQPRISLELHVAKLKERQRDPELVVSMLTELGYVHLDGKAPDQLLNEVDKVGVARGALRLRSDPQFG